jgi:hypothetical protein
MRTTVLTLIGALTVTAAMAAQRPANAPPSDDQVKCANLIYAVSKTSVCFSEKFLDTVRQETNCQPQRTFTAVKLAVDDVFQCPFAIMTGEGQFQLTEQERKTLKSYLTRGGFLLASAGCSSVEWDRSFRQEIRKVFPDKNLTRLKMTHPIFHTVFDIRAIKMKKPGAAFLEGLEIDGKIVLIYSPEGLNDTANASSQGKQCCCCGGNEISNSQEINVNIFTYALTH